MKHPQLTITVFLLMLLFNISGYGLNNYYFNIIGRDKGLSQSNVKAIIQDSNGFMWFVYELQAIRKKRKKKKE